MKFSDPGWNIIWMIPLLLLMIAVGAIQKWFSRMMKQK